ncbi:MAG: xylulokinase [Shimia sp.]
MYLGLDLGTSSLKALIVDETQAVVAEASAPLAVSRPHSGWSEQDPDAWTLAAKQVLSALPARAKAAVRAIGLSGQMHGATYLGVDDRPLGPCILWNDTRAAVQASAMDADPMWREITGNIVFPGFTAPKLAWLRDTQPEVFVKVHRVLLPKDALRLWLTGEAVSEMSDAAGTSWLDTARRAWSERLLAATNLSTDQMPRLIEGSAPSGGLRADLATRFGLPSVPVAGGGGDNAASAIGMGVVREGEGFVSLGTSGVLFVATDSYRPAPETAVHTFCHAVPGRWHQMGVILACADAVSWAARLVGQTPEEFTAPLGQPRAPGHALFLPYLGGERTPLADASVRGAFLGLDHADDTRAIAQAVVEGVCFALADCRDALAATGTRLDTIHAVGGGTASEGWLRILANALGLTLSVPDTAALGGAFGAARLAMLADGAGEDILTPPPAHHIIEPDPALSDAFAAGHTRYRAAARAIQGLD